ncbi:MAG: DNA (cytosine-5-)-methyltransferase [Cyanobacteria bacterium P01_F01_bin.153]
MKILSLFSGCGAFEISAQRSPHLTTIAVAENDPYPAAVLQHHFPEIPNLGDVTTIDATKYRGAVDVVVGGSPCQDFSVNGDRRGLGGEKSSLLFHQVRVAYECEAPWFVWENVVGANSSNGGADFAAVLGLLVRCGYSVAWRRLRATDFGLPQSRDRLLLVGHLGADPEKPARVLAFDKSYPWANPAIAWDCEGEVRDQLSQATFGFNGKRHLGTAQLERCPTLLAGGHRTTWSNDGNNMAVISPKGIRWLSHCEKCKLQGFPAGWLDIPDVPRRFRHKIIGNSIPVPFCEFVLNGIAEESAERF